MVDVSSELGSVTVWSLCLSRSVVQVYNHYGLQTVRELDSGGVALLITYCFPRPNSYLLTYLLTY